MSKKNSGFLPILPMRDVLVYPQMVVPVFIGRKKSVSALENALMTDTHEILLVAQKDSQKNELGIEDLYTYGILSKVIQLVKYPDGNIKALVEGISRVKINEIIIKDDFFVAQYDELEDEENYNEDLQALINLTIEKFKDYIQRTTKMSIENLISLSDIKESGRLSDIITSYLNIKADEKEKIIEILNPYERLEFISKILSRELEMLTLEESIQEKLQFKLGKSQKEYILKEKLRAIKEELEGEGGIDETSELKNRIDKAKIPKYVKVHLYKELAKLERMSFLTAETSVIHTYVDTLLELPWSNKTREIIDINEARKILDEDHYGLDDVKERILEFLAVKQLTKVPQATIICFTGPPGVGKTSLAKSIARSLNRKFAQVSLGGINDESEIRGHRRTYVGAMPGRIIRAIQDAGTKNPVILLDEIEKMLPSHMGDPTAAMLEVLDPAQNSHFTDHYIDLPFDLSEVFFIATANSVDNLFQALLDRLEVIPLAGYTEEEKLNIAKKFLIPRQYKNNGVVKNQLKIQTTAIREIINSYTREAGVRNLERNIGKICRKYAIKKIEKTDLDLSIDKNNISDFLGVPKFEREKTEIKAQVGLVHALAWTQLGGEILDIEATTMPGNGKLTLTGRLGEIMQESAKAAFSYVRSQHSKLFLPQNIQEKFDIHIHATDGATPKDGPSAGIAMTLCIISALTNRPIKADVAMTGEITLRGRVLPIGGLKEKCIAALRAGITNVIIPKANEKDLAEIPDYVKDKIKFKIVSNMSEVIDFALLQQGRNLLSHGKIILAHKVNS